jgi:glycosyltransferase involved in cell wall biosynthesis
MSNPAISIIIACFNARSTLGVALASLFAQTYKDFEIVVIDGASVDGTAEFLATYGASIDTWISEPDTGIYDAWNKGLQLARGRWIGFLGADDVFLPNALEEYFLYVTEHPDVNYVSSRVELFNNLGNTRIIGQPWQWSQFRRYMSVAHVGSLHSISLFRKFGIFNPVYQVCGDYEMLLRVGPELQAGYINKILSRMSTGGISNLNRRTLNETRQAKIHTNSVSPIIAYWDYLVALVKWYARQKLSRL